MNMLVSTNKDNYVKKYQMPVLTEFGSLTSLTLGASGENFDDASQSCDSPVGNATLECSSPGGT
jgi:hypothetical protein